MEQGDLAEIRELRKKILQYQQQITAMERRMDAILELESPRRSSRNRLDRSQVCELLDAAINMGVEHERFSKS